jgi:hypothetical protein
MTMYSSYILALWASFTLLTWSFPLAVEDSAQIAFRTPAPKSLKPRDDAVHIFNRGVLDNVRFENCDEARQAAIRDMLETIAILSGGIAVDGGPINAQTLLFQRSFGTADTASALNCQNNINVTPFDYEQVIQTVQTNFENLAHMNDPDRPIVLTIRCDDAGTARTNDAAGRADINEVANVANGNTLNLFTGFWELPHLREIWGQIDEQTEMTMQELDFLRNREGALLHELLHVTGIGLNQFWDPDRGEMSCASCAPVFVR